VYPKLNRRVFLYLLFVAGLFLLRAGTDEPRKETDKDKKAGSAEIYEPGGAVKAPKLVHYVEPAFSSQSKEAFIEGIVKISTVITAEGQPSDPHIVSGLNAEEDRTAVEALKQWRFQPGTKDGKPVNVKVTIEVAFHLL
jgi:TonB family protein